MSNRLMSTRDPKKKRSLPQQADLPLSRGWVLEQSAPLRYTYGAYGGVDIWRPTNEWTEYSDRTKVASKTLNAHRSSAASSAVLRRIGFRFCEQPTNQRGRLNKWEHQIQGPERLRIIQHVPIMLSSARAGITQLWSGSRRHVWMRWFGVYSDLAFTIPGIPGPTELHVY